MQQTLTTELFWLVLTILLTAVMWIPYILNRLSEQGFLTALWDPDGKTASNIGWANRMMSAHVNAVENLVIFAPLVIILHVTGSTNSLTATTCAIYFFARLTHFIVFALRVPVMRIITFAIGFMMQMILVYTLLTAS